MTFPEFSWSKPRTPPRQEARPFKHLRPGTRYQVIRSFVDYDGAEHAVGERWIFAGSNFLPYDDGLSLFVTDDEGHLQHIRLQWRPESQGAMIDALEDHIAEID